MRHAHLASVALFAFAISVNLGCTESRDAQTTNGQSGGAPSINVPLPGVDDGNRTCIGVVPERTTPAPTKGDPITGPTSPGALKPTWTLEDVQPQSCGANQTYGLDAFDGKPLMVVLLWGGCGFCQSQAEKLQQMHYELRAQA